MGDSVIQVRTCKRCGQNLTFDANVLEQFVACPYCGTFFPKVLPSIESGTIEAELKKLADDFGGLEIFSEENASRFAKSLMTLSAPFDVARDKLLVANIRKIPQKLYSVLDKMRVEQQQMTDLCIDELASFGFPESFAIEVVSWIVHVLQMQVSVERKPAFEKVLGSVKLLNVESVSSWDVKAWKEKWLKEAPEYEYPTCKIGNQIWLAKNLDLNIYGTPMEYALNPKHGRIYGRSYSYSLVDTPMGGVSYIRMAESGWRVPTEEDFYDLSSYIKSLGLTVGEALKSETRWHGVGKQGLNIFGFDAYPTQRTNDGILKTSFWLSEKNSIISRWAVLNGNSDDLQFENAPDNSNDYACVRYVRDVKE
ncbi:MAG: FISUMP domain-containing protein [Fibrobacter sp.]|uniref:FISUMP domain-containing protein n=1 Tax=Fibrobacter sp. TaxID=35828 RepID=UPI002A91ADA8|nr:FISUMP domain-containing protein [Fibrobacter sp.]MDY6265287.1 FISUMP domain-containing protein [Fibrobacter sp.]